MKRNENIKSYSAGELKAKRPESLTKLAQLDSVTDAELEQRIAEDADESGLCPDWTQAKLIMPGPKKSVHLRLEQDIVEYFRSQGKGHIVRMQAVLKAYVNAHRPGAK